MHRQHTMTAEQLKLLKEHAVEACKLLAPLHHDASLAPLVNAAELVEAAAERVQAILHALLAIETARPRPATLVEPEKSRAPALVLVEPAPRKRLETRPYALRARYSSPHLQIVDVDDELS